MIRVWQRALAAAAFLAMALYCATHLRLQTDLIDFLPAGSDTVLASLSKHLTDSDLSRTLVLTLGAESIDTAVGAAQRVAAGLRANPEVAWLRAGVDADQAERIFEIYFPRRHGFLFEEPEREAPALLGEAGLRERARRLARELSGRAAPLVERTAAEDPLLAFLSLLGRIRAEQRDLDLYHGQFVTADRRHAVLFLGTHASAFDPARQRRLQQDLAGLVSAAESELGAEVALEQSSVGRFTTHIEASVQRDVRMIVIVSVVGVALVFLVFFGSVRALGIALLPPAFGVLISLTVGLLWFGPLNGLAVAFAVALIGVSLDYSIHLMGHRALAPPGESVALTVRRLRPTLLLGGFTTLASFVGLAFTSFPGFLQMGVLATFSVGGALGASLVAIPPLSAGTNYAPFSVRLASALGRRALALRGRRGPLLGVALVASLAGLAALPQIQWIDDLRDLTSLDPALVAEEMRVRSRVSRFEANRFAVILTEDWESGLARNDSLSRALERAVAAGALEGFRSLHGLLWSQERQRRSELALRRDSDLPARLDEVYAGEGFRPGAFQPFAQALAAPPPEPLTLDELRGSALGDAVRPLIAEVGGRRALITYLRGIRDEDAVRTAIEEVDGAVYFDQRRFVQEVYGEYRERTVGVVVSGCFAVLGLLWLRYRRLRPSLAAFLPSLVVALALAALAVAFDTRVSLLHLIGLVLVMGIGVDYGIFVVDSQEDSRQVGVTMLNLLLAALTTLLVFGVLALSEHPILNALGFTAGLGVLLAFLLAPLALLIVTPPPGSRS